PGAARGEVLHAGDGRAAEPQATDGPLPPADEAAAEQGLRQLRPALAGGNRVLGREAPPRLGSQRPELPEPRPGTYALRPDLQPDAKLALLQCFLQSRIEGDSGRPCGDSQTAVDRGEGH